MATPESKVKRAIRRVLDAFKVYYFMPVQMGFGAAGVDFHCVTCISYRIDGMLVRLPIAFFIEAKKEDKEATARQENFLRDRREQQNCKTFVIDDEVTLAGLAKWLKEIEAHNELARSSSDL